MSEVVKEHYRQQGEERAIAKVQRLITEVWTLSDTGRQIVFVEDLYEVMRDAGLLKDGKSVPFSAQVYPQTHDKVEWLDEPIPVPNPLEGETK